VCSSGGDPTFFCPGFTREAQDPQSNPVTPHQKASAAALTGALLPMPVSV
jgi:hypothetical protein